jgi:hypothetical protein
MGKIGSTEALSCLFGVVHESPDTETFGQCLRAIGEALEFQPNERALQNITSGPSWPRPPGPPCTTGSIGCSPPNRARTTEAVDRTAVPRRR